MTWFNPSWKRALICSFWLDCWSFVSKGGCCVKTFSCTFLFSRPPEKAAWMYICHSMAQTNKSEDYKEPQVKSLGVLFNGFFLTAGEEQNSSNWDYRGVLSFTQFSFQAFNINCNSLKVLLSLLPLCMYIFSPSIFYNDPSKSTNAQGEHANFDWKTTSTVPQCCPFIVIHVGFPPYVVCMFLKSKYPFMSPCVCGAAHILLQSRPLMWHLSLRLFPLSPDERSC